MIAAAKVLRQTQRELSGLRCPPPSGPFPLHLRDLGTTAERALLDKLPSGYARADQASDHVYVIGLEAPTSGAFDILRNSFNVARLRSGKETAFCRSIEDHTAPQVIYVGRSKKLRSRIAQHLDGKRGRTYAMHMGSWAKGLDLEVFVSYITLTGKSDNLVQAVEDGLWSALTPAMGKQGPR